MAKETKGYPVAFQILGYLCYPRHRYGKATIKDIRESLGISPQMLNVYRMRLIRQDIADGSPPGHINNYPAAFWKIN